MRASSKLAGVSGAQPTPLTGTPSASAWTPGSGFVAAQPAPAARVGVLLADRGFGDQTLYASLGALGWNYVIRFRDCILVEDEKGQSRPGADRVAPRGRAVRLPNARVIADRAPVPAVVVPAAKMKEPWCLATSLAERKAQDVIALHGKRFSIEEETFRDEKDIHRRPRPPARRGRLRRPVGLVGADAHDAFCAARPERLARRAGLACALRQVRLTSNVLDDCLCFPTVRGKAET
jgi:hypothetical protein